MALEGDAECPKCPSTMDHSGMSHHGDSGEKPHHGNSQDSADSDVPCATSGFDCMLVDEFGHDNRSGELKLKDVPNHTSLGIIQTNIALPNVPQMALRNFERYAFAAPRAAPPLNVLYCVYLK